MSAGAYYYSTKALFSSFSLRCCFGRLLSRMPELPSLSTSSVAVTSAEERQSNVAPNLRVLVYVNS